MAVKLIFENGNFFFYTGEHWYHHILSSGSYYRHFFLMPKKIDIREKSIFDDRLFKDTFYNPTELHKN